MCKLHLTSMFLKALAAAAIAITGFTAMPAQASSRCHNINGYRLCTVDNGAYGTDHIGVYNSAGQNLLVMNVICTGNSGNRWQSSSARGEFTKPQLQAIANWWCAGY